MKSIDPEDFEILKEKISRKYQIEKETGCWIWEGKPNQDGYGVYGFYRAKNGLQDTWLAHRLSWELNRGPIPSGLVIDHLCGQKICINPEHLNPTTNYGNSGRQHSLKNIKCANPDCTNLRSTGRKGLCERCRNTGVTNTWQHLEPVVLEPPKNESDDPFQEILEDFPLLKSRLFARMEIDENNCWNWLGEKQAKGYGRIELIKNGRRLRFSTHRLMYRIAGNHLDNQLVIDHMCSNKSCINPEHMEAVTMESNSARAGKMYSKFNNLGLPKLEK